MGKRLFLSTPANINVGLTPFVERFEIDASDVLEQWYFADDGSYSPNRNRTPLVLTPSIQVFDQENNNVYNPSLYVSGWYIYDASNSTDYSSDPLWPGLHWVKITNVSDTQGAEYVVSGNNLIVKKNVPPTDASYGGVNLTCVIRYIDPRDTSVTYQRSESVHLATSKDASLDSITISTDAPSSTLFNPLFDESVKTIVATALDQNGTDISANVIFQWYAKVAGSVAEVLLNTLPCYYETDQPSGGGQGTRTVSIDLMYQERIDIICKAKLVADGPFIPSMEQRSFVWKYPSLEVVTACDCGGGVDAVNRPMTFRNIVNSKLGVVSEADVMKHFQFAWKSRTSTASSFASLGVGPTVTVQSRALRNTTSYSTNVQSDVYFCGPLEEVTYSDNELTQGGETIYCRQGIPTNNQ